MDKRKNQISIKLNGQNRFIKEYDPKENEVEHNPIDSIQNPADIKGNSVDEEIAAGKDEEEKEFPWVLSDANNKDDLDDLSEFEIELENLKKGKSNNDLKREETRRDRAIPQYKISHEDEEQTSFNGNWPPEFYNRKPTSSKSIRNKRFKPAIPYKLLSAIAFAIIVGTGFGLFLLQLLSGSDSEPVNAQPKANDPITSINQKNTKPASTQDAEDNQTDTSMKNITLQPLTFYVIQAGVFSTTDSASQMQASLQQKGISAQFFGNKNPIYLFIGAGPNETLLKSVQPLLDEKGVETYVKSYEIVGGTVSINPTHENGFVASPELVLLMARLSTEGLLGSSISEEDWTLLNQTYNAWKDVSLPTELSSFVDNINKSYQILINYKDSQARSILWDSQQQLLNALKNYQQYINS